MFDSQSPADKLPCGHMAHLSCIRNTTQPLDNICTVCNSAGRHAATARLQATNRSQAASSDSIGGTRKAQTTAGAARAVATAGSRPGSSSQRPVSALIRDLLDLMGPEATSGEDAGALDMMQELEEEELLPRREVRVSVQQLCGPARSSLDTTTRAQHRDPVIVSVPHNAASSDCAWQDVLAPPATTESGVMHQARF